MDSAFHLPLSSDAISLPDLDNLWEDNLTTGLDSPLLIDGCRGEDLTVTADCVAGSPSPGNNCSLLLTPPLCMTPSVPCLAAMPASILTPSHHPAAAAATSCQPCHTPQVSTEGSDPYTLLMPQSAATADSLQLMHSLQLEELHPDGQAIDRSQQQVACMGSEGQPALSLGPSCLPEPQTAAATACTSPANTNSQPVKRSQYYRLRRARDINKTLQLEKQVALMTAEFNQLQCENSHLKQRMVVLDSVLQSLSVAESSKLPSLLNSDTAVKDVASKQQGAPPIGRTSSAPSASSRAMHSSFPSSKQPQHPTTTVQDASSDSITQAAVCVDQLLRKTFTDFVHCAAPLVVSWEVYPTPATAQKLAQLVANLAAGTTAPEPDFQDAIVRNLYVNMCTGEKDCPGEELWRAVAGSLSLSQEQLSRCKVALGIWQGKMDQLKADREQMAQGLAQCLGWAQIALCEEPKQQVHAVEAEELLTKMGESLAKEKAVFILMGACLAKGVLEPYQVAKMFVASFPYIPDFLAICRIASELRL